jgi:hypothetical protein
MSQQYEIQVEPEANQHAAHLAERLDPAIGEATTVMGAMLTELLRRTLRGGVMRISDELHHYASERVDAAVAERTPAIERAATAVAETAAKATATVVVTEQVQALEQKTRESDEQLAAQFGQAVTDTARDLSNKIVETERKAVEATTEKARELTVRIEEAEKHAEDTTLETARGLTSQIQETEQRVTEFAKTEISQQVQDLLERARKKAAALEGRFKDLETRTVALRNEFTEGHAAVREDVQQRTAALSDRLGQEGKERRATEESLRGEIAALLRTNEALAARVAELERPRGLRGLFAWLFGGRPANGKAATKPAAKANGKARPEKAKA